MKTELEVTFISGEVATYVAANPEWVKWERKFNTTVNEAETKLGLEGLNFLAYNAMKREAAGNPVKPYEVWIETIESITSKRSDPKAGPSEA
ncbi:hypothetical protein UFOVP362_19 [uncultured Caudovirales phage]|jgi:hypothetical protein|uniref:Uncharacterized protein n=1 Tax=uncultured Caudovirales phage TaxID=2100421 RepID=A0A6J7WZ70_9CAUD|nr:hypothetical protein UFOVP362_19 [uncultured Caudovirales phage]